MEFTCDVCQRTFKYASSLKEHAVVHALEKTFSCSKCEKGFSRRNNAKRHEKNCRGVAPPPPQQPRGCGLKRPRIRNAAHPHNFNITKTSTAFRGATITWKLRYPSDDASSGYMDVIESSTQAMSLRLERFRTDRRALKFMMTLHAVFEKATDPSIVTSPPAVLCTEAFEVYEGDDLQQLLCDAADQIENRIQVWQADKSGWVLHHLVALDTTVWELDPLRASNSTFRPSLTWVRNTGTVVNVKNTDQQCFRHAVVAGLYAPSEPTQSGRVASYAYCADEPDYPDFSDLKYPVRVKDIDIFERNNPDISVNVFRTVEEDEELPPAEPVAAAAAAERPPRHRRPAGFVDDEAVVSGGESDDDVADDIDGENVADLIDDSDDDDDDNVDFYRVIDNARRDEIPPASPPPAPIVVPAPEVPEPASSSRPAKRGRVFPVRITKNECARHVNLLITGIDGASYHYSTIKNFDGLVSAQYNRDTHKSYHCYRCLHGFWSKMGETSRAQCSLLQKHMTYCKTLKPQCVSYPEKNTITEFTNIQRMLKHPFAAYADFESFLRPENTDDDDVSFGIAEKKAKHVRFQKHDAASYFTKVVSIDSNFSLPDDLVNFPQQETYVGADAAEHFLDYIESVADGIYEKYIHTPKPLVMTGSDWQRLRSATRCHICEEAFKPGEKKARDHCHILGHFRGAAHGHCNLQYRIDPRRYDWI